MLGNNTYRFTVSDINSLIREKLRKQQQLFKTALKSPALNHVTKQHFFEMITMIDNKFTAEKNGLSK